MGEKSHHFLLPEAIEKDMTNRIEAAHDYIMEHARGKLTGDELRFACPNHSHADGVDSHPSFSYNVVKKVGRCLSCPFSGGATRIAEAMGWSGQLAEEVGTRTAGSRIEAIYDYRDENGCLLYQVVRYMPKAFLQRRELGNADCLGQLGFHHRPESLPRLPGLEITRQCQCLFHHLFLKPPDGICSLSWRLAGKECR